MQHSNFGVDTGTDITGYVIRNNIVRNNVVGVFMSSDGSSQSLVTRNKVLANNKGFDDPVPPDLSGGGIVSFDGLSNAVVSGNFVGLNRGAGIFFINCEGGVNINLTVVANTLQNNAIGVGLFGNNTAVKIHKNTADDTLADNDLDVEMGANRSLSRITTPISSSVVPPTAERPTRSTGRRCPASASETSARVRRRRRCQRVACQ